MGNGNSEALAKVLNYYGLYQNRSVYKVVCPFHNDQNASMLIDIPNARYYCFGCCASGDALKFVMNIEKSKDDLAKLKKYFSIINSKNKSIESCVKDIPKGSHNKKNGNAYIEDAMKELDKILKDDDNPFELEEQYRWEWLDDTE